MSVAFGPLSFWVGLSKVAVPTPVALLVALRDRLDFLGEFRRETMRMVGEPR